MLRNAKKEIRGLMASALGLTAALALTIGCHATPTQAQEPDGGAAKTAAGSASNVKALVNVPGLWHKSPDVARKAFEAAKGKVVVVKEHWDNSASDTMYVTFPKGITLVAEFGKRKLADVEVYFDKKLSWSEALAYVGVSAKGVTEKPSEGFNDHSYTALSDLNGIKGFPVDLSVATFCHFTPTVDKEYGIKGLVQNNRYRLSLVSTPLGP